MARIIVIGQGARLWPWTDCSAELIEIEDATYAQASCGEKIQDRDNLADVLALAQHHVDQCDGKWKSAPSAQKIDYGVPGTRYGPTGHPIDPVMCTNALGGRCGPIDCVLDHAVTTQNPAAGYGVHKCLIKDGRCLVKGHPNPAYDVDRSCPTCGVARLVSAQFMSEIGNAPCIDPWHGGA